MYEALKKFINISEILHMLRRNIAETLLKILCKNLYTVKSYDKTNMIVFALSLWENISWGFAYFDQFTSDCTVCISDTCIHYFCIICMIDLFENAHKYSFVRPLQMHVSLFLLRLHTSTSLFHVY